MGLPASGAHASNPGVTVVGPCPEAAHVCGSGLCLQVVNVLAPSPVAASSPLSSQQAHHTRSDPH